MSALLHLPSPGTYAQPERKTYPGQRVIANLAKVKGSVRRQSELGGNALQGEKLNQLRRFLVRGYSIRDTARRVGAAKKTVIKYRRLFGILDCRCGKPISHAGICEYRITAGIREHRVKMREEAQELREFRRKARGLDKNDEDGELTLLVNMRGFRSLDSVVIGKFVHEYFPSHCQSPDELLMQKEEYEERQHEDRISHYAERIVAAKTGRAVFSYSSGDREHNPERAALVSAPPGRTHFRPQCGPSHARFRPFELNT